MKNDLREELVNLIGNEYTEKIFNYDLDGLIKEQDLNADKFNFALDFFKNADFEDIKNYYSDDSKIDFFGIVKKFYDKELKCDAVVSGCGNRLVLNRKFGFEVKKKIAKILSGFEDVEYCKRLFDVLDLIKSDDEFLKCETCLQEIVIDERLYKSVLTDKKKFWDAVNIARYGLSKIKRNLSFDNLVFLTEIIIAVGKEKQSNIKVWIDNIDSDLDCELIEPVFISIIGCKKLADDVLKKKISVSEALEIYDKIRKEVINDKLSEENLNAAFNIVINLQDDNDFSENRLNNAIKLIKLIYDDGEFNEIKIFIKFLSVFDELPKLVKKNNFSLTEILPVILKIYFAGGEIVLKKDFSFNAIRKISFVLEKCNKSETRIKNVLSLIENISVDSEFYYCEKFLCKLAVDKEIFFKSMKQVKDFYVRCFMLSPISVYTSKIINEEKFSFECIRKCEKLILKRKKNVRNIVCNLILKLKDDNEFVFAEKFLSDFNFDKNFKLDDREKFDLISMAKGYYKKILNISEYDDDKLKIFDNKNLSFESLKDGIEFFVDEKDNLDTKKITDLVCMIESDEEYKILRPFFKTLIGHDEIFLGNQNVLFVFRKIVYDEADKFKVRKIFNNRFLDLAHKVEAMNYLKELDDNERERIVNLICKLGSNDVFDQIKIYFDSIKSVKKLTDYVNFGLLTPEHIIKIFELDLGKIWFENKISIDKLKKLIWYLPGVKNKREKDGFLKLIELAKTDDEFDIIIKHAKDLIKNNDIMSELDSKKFDCGVICGIYKFRAERIFKNKNFSFLGVSALKKVLERTNDFFKRKHIINIACAMSNEADFVYIKEFLSMGEINKSDKNYVLQASRFYIEKLIDKYGKEYEDVKDSIIKLVNERKFSYYVLEQMADLLNRYKSKKERTVLFNKMISLKSDRDYTDNIKMVLDFSQEAATSDEKESFSVRMKKAEETANSENGAANSGGGGGGNPNSPLIFSDGNVIINLVNANLILQFKDKKLVIMTTEDVSHKNDVLKGKFTAWGIKINQAIDENLKLFDGDGIKYFYELRDYLNDNGDSAVVEEDSDEGIVYKCLITPQNIESVIEANIAFCKIKTSSKNDKQDDKDNDDGTANTD